MSNLLRSMVLALAVFTMPMSYVVYSNWTAFEPFVVGDPKTSDGYVLFFTTRRG